MPIPIEILLMLKKADEYRRAGKFADAQATVLQTEVMLESLRPALNPTEKLLCSAAVAKSLKQCGDIYGAMLRFEKVCELALKLDPDDSQTVGDLWDLAECYQELGKLPEALAAYQRARSICARAAPECLPALDIEIQTLLEKMAAAELKPARSFQVQAHVQCLSVNYSLVHCGLSPLASLQVQNELDRPARDVSIQVTIPGYTMPSDPVILQLEAGEMKDISDQIILNFVLDRLAAQIERARAPIEVSINGHLADRRDIWVLAYNECSWQPGHEKTLAAFVHPNNAAVRVIAKQARGPLRQLTGQESFLAVRESKVSNRVDTIVQSVYRCLSEQYDLVYDYEPPSWESNSQRVRFPDEVIVNGIGTCNDFMLLVTSVLENLLYGSRMQPVMVITVGAPGHALVGCWRDSPLSDEAVIADQRQVAKWVDSGGLFLMDSTGFARDNPFRGRRIEFEECVEIGKALVYKAERLYAVNLAAIRPDYETGRPGITPLPFRPEPPYAESALRALQLSRQAWKESPTAQIQSAHLLIGLLKMEGGAAAQFFDTLAHETANPLLTADKLSAYLAAGLRQRVRPALGQPVETESYAVTKLAASQEVRRLHALMVEDLHLLFATLRRPGESVTKALQQRHTSPAECLAFLERLHPAPPEAAACSEFPSEVQE